ncbi:response regulator [Larkinella rosea]|nr:response regulator [Larkinella rosea]
MRNSESDDSNFTFSPPASGNEHPTLCFIEDNDDNLTLYEWINSRYMPEYTFELYTDERFLNQRFNDSMPRPDLIFLDLKMPQISGGQLLTKLKEDPEWKHVPVVIFTHSTSPKDMEQCMDAGADGFFNKDISVHGIKSQLIEICEICLK